MAIVKMRFFVPELEDWDGDEIETYGFIDEKRVDVSLKKIRMHLGVGDPFAYFEARVKGYITGMVITEFGKYPEITMEEKFKIPDLTPPKFNG